MKHLYQENIRPNHNVSVPNIYIKEIKESLVISEALYILENRAKYQDNFTTSCPDDTKKFIRLKLSNLEQELFSILLLDNRHRLIKYVQMFQGTIDGASVYPREVVKEALKANAAAIIIAHNHPSGVSEPSNADERITLRIKDACSTVDIRLLDHLIVGSEDIVSLAERGVI